MTSGFSDDFAGSGQSGAQDPDPTTWNTDPRDVALPAGSVTVEGGELLVRPIESSEVMIASVESHSQTGQFDSQFTIRYDPNDDTSNRTETIARFTGANNNGLQVRLDSRASFVSLKNDDDVALPTVWSQAGTFLGGATRDRIVDALTVRVRLDGDTVSMKIWEPTDPEPTAWDVETTIPERLGAGVFEIESIDKFDTDATIALDDIAITALRAVDSGNDETLTSYDYNDDQQPISEQLIDGSRTWTYVDGRVATYEEVLPGSTISTSLTYDSIGRVATETTNGVTTTYTYDDASQLRTANNGAGNDQAWGYDALGRRTSSTHEGTTTTYVYDEASQLCWTATTAAPGPCGVVPVDAVEYDYDASGKLTTETSTAAATNLNYDAAGRPARSETVTGGNVAVSSRSYDPNHRLTQVSGIGGGIVDLTWDSTLATANLIQLDRNDGTGAMSLAAGIGGWAAAASADGVTVMSADVRGSVVATPSTAGLAQSSSYDPFGNSPHVDGFRLGYRGEIHIDGLVHLRARDYRADLGQFTSADPVDGANGRTTVANRYHYADNDPLHRADPLARIFRSDRWGSHENALRPGMMGVATHPAIPEVRRAFSWFKVAV